jgi:hypothetical protein
MYIAKGVTPCQVEDPRLWFAKARSRMEQQAVAWCNQCDERMACLASTLQFEQRNGAVQPAVFGGLTESQRIVLRRQSA